MKKSFYLSFMVFMAVCFMDTQAALADSIKFDFKQSGSAHQLARIAVADILEPQEQKLGRKLILFTAKADLNNDTIPEIFVKLADKKIFCDTDGNCPTYVFAVTDNGPVSIGSFTSNTIEIDDQRTGPKTIIAKNYDGTKKNYVWRDGAYALESDTTLGEQKESTL